MAAVVRSNADPGFEITSLREEAQAAIREFMAAGDVEGALDAYTVEVTIHLNGARWHECAAAAQQGEALATAAGMDRRRNVFAGWVANATLWGPDDATAGVATIEALMGATSRRLARSTMLSTIGTLRGVLNDRPGAEAALAESSAIRAELGYVSSWFRGAYAMYALDDLPEALRLCRAEIADLERRGETGNRSTMLAVAALILARVDRGDEALEAAAESFALGQSDDAVTQLTWRAAAGTVHARRGELDQADELTRQAVEIADQTDFLEVGAAYIARAEALAALDRRDAAVAAAGHARQLYVRKGYVKAIRRVDALELG
jgi:tetratricopeptide (TPR) repeat protein